MRTPEQILRDSTTIAVVGASRYPDKTAHAVPLQLLRHGWRVIPVNPYAEEIWGQRCYPTLAAIPERVDLVNVFRPSRDTPPVAREAVAIGASALWLQQGIASEESWAIAEAAGLDYVEDHCIAVERAVRALSKLAG
ncbi:CoA-binding protein [Rugosimonospora africana]|uniref:Succinyl-CoA ligase subunit alpha n=1 Tax=Rugosimonospora africana TaxID=556532 RepID=A0A8J3QMB6_9ACTN|nr:CoA-binding protein [Rugosimonospora africana]GIH12529.1 succinyl-CoA ligase subunit alpha [Rugosimonospora africana]